MAKEFFLTKWVRGWRLDRFFDNLFQKKEDGTLSIKESAQKVVNAIDNVLEYEDEAELITAAISDDAELSVQQVIGVIVDVKTMVAAI